MTEFLPITDTKETKERVYDGPLGMLYAVAALILLACSPALVVIAWKAAF